jgi:uncharacterized protein (DUF58 family)
VRTGRLAAPPISAPARVIQRWAAAPTARAAILFGAGLLWLAPAWIEPRAIVLMLVWNAVAAAALVIDAYRLPRAGTLRVTRAWEAPLTLGTPVTVSLELLNGGTTLIAARLTDHLPPALRHDLPPLDITVPPGRSVVARYDVTPHERGDARAGQVVIEWRSAWGLVERWGEVPLEQTVRVYPDLVEARRHSLYLIRSHQVALEKRRARRAGSGREFDRLREYRAGDERRDVSWSASARRAKLVTRVYQPERSQTVWLLVDSGRLLRARTGDHTLLDRATTAALAVAQVAIASGDTVGLLAYGRRIQHRLAPARGAGHLRELTEAMALVRGEAAEADHGGAAAALRAAQKRRALIVWLTEVAETAGIPDVIEYATSLVPRHVVLFATMRQPELEAVTTMRPSTATDMYRVVAAQEALDRRESLLRGLRRHGALVMETSPGGLAGGLVDRYLEIKERGML